MKKVESIKELRRICQKPVIKLNTFYPRMVSRRISIYITKLFLYTNVSANNVTLLMILVGIIASIFFGFDQYIYSLLGALFLQFWFILDHVDGEIARYRKQSSIKGVFMDLLNHHIIHPLIFIFIGIGLYKNLGDFRILIMGTFIIFSLLLQDLINLDKKEASLWKAKNLYAEEKDNFKKSLFKRITQVVYKFPGIMNIVTIAALFNQLYLIFLFYGFTFPIMILLKIIYHLKMSEDKF